MNYAASLIAFIEGLTIVLNPADHHIEEGLMGWNVLVLIIPIALEGFALRTALKEAAAYKEKINPSSIKEALDEMQDPVLLSLLTEDSLALGGLLIALIGVCITIWLKAPIIDGITSLTIGGLLIVGAVLLAIENKIYLIGKGVGHRVQQQIK